MNEVSASLTTVLAEAQALLRDLDCAAPTARRARADGAVRLLAAAETCHRVLVGTPRPTFDAHRPVRLVDTAAIRDCSRGGSRAVQGGKHALSRRELEVLRLIAAGYRDRQIAETLVLSPRTVTSHVTAILNKFGAESRTAAVAHAIRSGLV